ncbi:hypothetical protein SAMN04488514_111115 [Kriegella aquimaris]|uniref:Uncharacterized protein n=1 Tax=Kriegella aquimaris TaxID=192904 RepID=A0A1G9UPE3_9FLAO|nr:hypothetical protein SAMN04488514_111115 [Kriegella aquimaris]
MKLFKKGNAGAHSLSPLIFFIRVSLVLNKQMIGLKRQDSWLSITTEINSLLELLELFDYKVKQFAVCFIQ